MGTYRVFFRAADNLIVGRDDFDAGNDVRAVVVARMLRDACSDKCADFEVWQGTRRVDMPCRKWADAIDSEAENIALERELAIRASRWTIADSRRLLEETRRLLNQTRGRT